METIAIIPARGGSKRILRKNLYPIAGKPLIAYTILAAKQSKKIDGVFVSTEDEEIASVAKHYGADIIQRPAELAMDDSSSEDAIKHALGSIVADGGSIKQFCLLQPTSPLRTAQHIDDAIDLYHQANDRPLISVTSAPSNINKLLEGSAHGIRPVFGQVEFGARPSSVAPFRYVPNGAIYIVSIAHFFETGSLYDSMMTPFIMHRTCSIDIDYPEDIRMAEALIEAAWGL
jgi:CMP-N,N'-diacetyllegionaminic acid synthase